MRLQSDPRLPQSNPATAPLTQRLYEVFRQWAVLLNGSTMWETSGTAAPTTGTFAKGDMCKNTAPSEAGTAGSKYVVMGWICTATGTPGTWMAMRVLTGN